MLSAATTLARRTMATTSSAAAGKGGRLFLGLDSSTQGLKATAVDDALGVVHTFALNYQRDLGAAYGLTNGTIAKPGSVVVQPTLMYVAALEALLAQMKAAGFPFERVAAVSGSGQQHGSAYWKTGARATLRALQPGAPLTAQLAGAFSVAESPIWMDSSTSAQCAALGACCRGAAAVGARARGKGEGGGRHWLCCAAHSRELRAGCRGCAVRPPAWSGGTRAHS